MKFVRALPALSILLLVTCAAQTALPPVAARPAAAARYRAFDSQGRAVKLEDLAAALDRADVLVVGEMHDDAVGHLVEAELLRLADERAGARDKKDRRAVALSLEMFERDVQPVIDEYLAGLISERHFLLSSRPWRNYETDYRPLVEYAKGRGLQVIAANAPARYVSRVTNNGPQSLAALPAQARAWLPPLPYADASEAYAAKFRRFMQSEEARAASPHGAPPNPHASNPAAAGPVYVLEAQTLRDAAMAHAVAAHLRRHERALVVHVNGAFHSEGRLGVPEHLKTYRPRARVLVVTIIPDGSPDFDPARHAASGDFVILTDPKTSDGRRGRRGGRMSSLPVPPSAPVACQVGAR